MRGHVFAFKKKANSVTHIAPLRTTKQKSWQFNGVVDGTVRIIVVTHKIANKGKTTKMTMKHFINERDSLTIELKNRIAL